MADANERWHGVPDCDSLENDWFLGKADLISASEWTRRLFLFTSACARLQTYINIEIDRDFCHFNFVRGGEYIYIYSDYQ